MPTDDHIWSHCSFCMTHQWHTKNGEIGYVCDTCQRLNPAVTVTVAVRRVGERYLERNPDEISSKTPRKT